MHQRAKQKQDAKLEQQFMKLRQEEELFVRQLDEEGEALLGPHANIVDVRHSVFELQIICQKIDGLNKQEGSIQQEARSEMKRYIDEVRKLRTARQRGDKSVGVLGKAAALASALGLASSASSDASASRPAASAASGSSSSRSERQVDAGPSSPEGDAPAKPLAAARAGPPPRISAAEARKREESKQAKKRGMWGRASAIDRDDNSRSTTLSEKLERIGGRRNSITKALIAASKASSARRAVGSIAEDAAEEEEEEESDSRAQDRRGSFMAFMRGSAAPSQPVPGRRS